MGRAAAVEIDWADGTHAFRLAIGQLVELQEKTGVGPMALWRRLVESEWRVGDLRETIRLGLIGGGAAPSAALTLVRDYVEARPLVESVPVAIAILAAALYGAPDEPVGKETAPPAATAGRESNSPNATPSAP